MQEATLGLDLARPRPARRPAVRGGRRADRRDVHAGAGPIPMCGSSRGPASPTSVAARAPPARSAGRSSITTETDDPRWFRRAVFYEILVRGFFDANDDGTGDLPGHHRPSSTTCQWLGIDCLWLLPFYQSPLRDGGYDISDFFTVLPEYGQLGRRGRAGRGGPQARHAHHRRPGHEPHQRPASLVPGVAPGPHQPEGRLVRVERRRPALARRPGHLRRHREVQLDLRRQAGPVLLAPVLLPPARPQLRQPRGGRRHARRGPVLARHRARRLPARRRALPVRARRHQRREPPGDPRVPEADPQGGRRRLPRPGPAGRGQPVAGGRRRLLRRRRRVPHVLSLSR